MERPCELTLTCTGFLHKATQHDNHVIAEICYVKQLKNSPRHETIWFKCRVEGRLAEDIVRLAAMVSDNCTVEIEFTASYSNTCFFQSGLTDEDPDHMIIITAELLTLHQANVSGVIHAKPLAD